MRLSTLTALAGFLWFSPTVGAQTPPPPTGAAAGSSNGTNIGTLQGTVRAAPTDAPLPYAVILIPTLGIERFSGANGFFMLGNVPVGSHEVVIRRLGFVPERRTVTIATAQTTVLDVRLAQVPVRLSSMLVRPAEPCKSPGLPDSTRFPEVAQLVGLLRENADRYRLLVKQYPYAYVQTRAFGQLLDRGLVVQRVDSIRVSGASAAEYRPGNVVKNDRSNGRNEYSMHLPTLLDLADVAFVRNHCFHYGGATVHDSETWFKLDVRAADRLSTPDVHGAFFLDSATAQLRRMELEMSRPERLPRELRTIRTVQVTTQFLEIAPGVSIIDNVCAVNWIKGRGPLAQHAAELQQVLVYAFSAPPPDIVPQGQRDTPPWRRGAGVPRTALSCVPASGET
jgi:hypothetical protein